MKLRKIITPIGPSIAYVPLTQGKLALIDIEDAWYVGMHNWHAWRDRCGDRFYARRVSRITGKPETILLHSFIMGYKYGSTVDHIETTGTLDNRRTNLRFATKSQQQYNQLVMSNNRSGFKGASWHSASGLWQASITVDRKRKHLGLFTTPKEAHEAYCAAAREHHREFARVA